MDKETENNSYIGWDDIALSDKLKEEMKFNAYFFRRAEIKIREEKRKQQYYSKRLEEIERQNKDLNKTK